MISEKTSTDHHAELASWLAARMPDASDVRVEGLEEAKAAGASAETLFLNASWREGGQPIRRSLVLRRQILGHDLLHQPELSFQARVMGLVCRQPCLAAPAPAVIGVEDDASLIGAPFLVMSRLPGRIVPQNPNYNLSGWLFDRGPAERAAIWEAGLAAMASVHRIDWRDGFSFMSRGKTADLAGYIDLTADWLSWAVAGRDFPLGEAAIDYLIKHMPADAPTEVLWGDPLPCNMLFDDDGKVSGLIDWEMAALGPGELDLAWWMMFDELFSTNFNVPRLEGLPDRARMIAVYEEAAGRRVGDMRYYDLLTRLRMSIVTMRAFDRIVAQGRYKADNDAWSHNPFTNAVATLLDLPPATPGPDYYEATAMMLAK
jgi:aminoglycoside phosphotransferase (APT) family kinase protein